MRDRPLGCRIACLASGALGFLAGFAARSELQRRLRRLNAGQLLTPDMPHRPVPDPGWLGGCWCGKPADASVHQARIAGSGAAR